MVCKKYLQQIMGDIEIGKIPAYDFETSMNKIIQKPENWSSLSYINLS
jgi:hypothetical protein